MNIFNVIIDTIKNSFERRYTKHGPLYADFSCLKPKSVPVNSETLPSTALNTEFTTISPFTSTLKLGDEFQLELIDFS